MCETHHAGAPENIRQLAVDWKDRLVKLPWVCMVLIAALGVGQATALTPLLDVRADYFVGDWLGTGGDDSYCFVRLRQDGSGTVLVSGASGDWFGAQVRWRNERQTLRVVEVLPLAANPRRRLMPLPQLTLTSGMNRTAQLSWNTRISPCELRLRSEQDHRQGEANLLLDTLPPVTVRDATR